MEMPPSLLASPTKFELFISFNYMSIIYNGCALGKKIAEETLEVSPLLEDGGDFTVSIWESFNSCYFLRQGMVLVLRGLVLITGFSCPLPPSPSPKCIRRPGNMLRGY